MPIHVLTNEARDIAIPIPRQRPALRLVSTKGMARETWLDVRRQGIGSSDAATAVGLNPYQSQLELWMHKTGKGDLLPSIDPLDETTPCTGAPCWSLSWQPITPSAQATACAA